jgi:hypothetical protein
MQLELSTDGIAAPDMHTDDWQLKVARTREDGSKTVFRVHMSDPDMQQLANSAIGRNLKPQGKSESMLPDLQENWEAMKSKLEAEIARRIAQKLGTA